MKALCPTCFGAGCVRCGLPPRSSKHAAAGRLGSVKAAHLRAHPVEPSSLPSNPPPGMTRERWVALLAEGARLDAIANRGAGPMRERD